MNKTLQLSWVEALDSRISDMRERESRGRDGVGLGVGGGWGAFSQAFELHQITHGR